MPPFGLHTKKASASHLKLVDILINYHNTKMYLEDIRAIGKQAVSYLTQLPDADQANENQVIVLDIDETSLHNSWELINPQNNFDQNAWDEWVNEAKAKPVKPTLDIYNIARKKGFKVFFISGRHPDQKTATENNLRKIGYEEWEETIFEPRSSDNPSLLVFPEAASFKTAARWSIVQRGYKIVLNVGDQLSDINGGFSDKTFLLPNPFYTVI